MTTLNALRNRYEELTTNRADGRWTEATLQEKVAEAQAKKDERDAAYAAEQARKEQAKAEREERATARGSWEQFSERMFARDLEGDEAKFAYVANRAKSSMENAEKTLADFATKLATDPTHALEWAETSFKAAAELAVAKYVKEAVEVGATFQQLRYEVMRNALRGARSPARSTSATSNLMETYTTAAWADLLDRMGE